MRPRGRFFNARGRGVLIVVAAAAAALAVHFIL